MLFPRCLYTHLYEKPTNNWLRYDAIWFHDASLFHSMCFYHTQNMGKLHSSENSWDSDMLKSCVEHFIIYMMTHVCEDELQLQLMNTLTQRHSRTQTFAVSHNKKIKDGFAVFLYYKWYLIGFKLVCEGPFCASEQLIIELTASCNKELSWFKRLGTRVFQHWFLTKLFYKPMYVHLTSHRWIPCDPQAQILSLCMWHFHYLQYSQHTQKNTYMSLKNRYFGKRDISQKYTQMYCIFWQMY